MVEKLEGCIFDLDGVIVDSAQFHYLSWVKIAEKFDFEFTESDNERLKGISRMNSLEIVLEVGKVKQSNSEKIKLCEQKNDIYLDYIKDLTPTDAMIGVRELIIELKDNNIKVALGSASKNARKVLNYLKLTEYFDAIVDGTDVTKSKPDPEVFNKGRELISTKADRTVVFEDANKGLQAAISGGFRTIGVGTDPSLNIAEFRIENFEHFSLDKLLVLLTN